MSIRIKFNIDYSISESTSGAKELGLSSPWTGFNDILDDGGTFRRRLTAGATNVAIDLMGLTAVRFLTIKSNKTITWKKNSSSGEPTTLRALGTNATDAILFMTTDGITSLYLSNPGTDDAEVTISLSGTI